MQPVYLSFLLSKLTKMPYLRFAAFALFADASSASASATTAFLATIRGADALGAVNAAGLLTMQALLLNAPANMISQV